jgi:hypothetical protein
VSAGLELVDSLEEALHLASWALVGTGWQSDLEQKAMRACARVGLPCVAVVDHWVNYADRFDCLTAAERPSHIVVTDSDAAQIARTQLPWATVNLWRNIQLEDFVRAVQHWETEDKQVEPYLLWLQEPIRDQTGLVIDPLTDRRYGPKLWDLLEVVARGHRLGRIVIRSHPSQASPSYERRELLVEIHDGSIVPLSQDVAGASLCLGINTYALYLSTQAGVKTLSVANVLGVPRGFPEHLVRDYG